MKRYLVFLMGFTLSSSLLALPASVPKRLQDSQQMLVVSAAGWDTSTGSLQRFERLGHSPWKKIGKTIPIVLGKQGMAWGESSSLQLPTEPIKKEGDNRTPAGVYSVGPLFGYAETSSFKLDYFPLTETSICVDDGKSAYYNQLLDSAKVPQIDWQSGEKMRTVPQYKIGGVVQYNQDPPTPGLGSCIFLHIWKNATIGTAGCVAMEENQLIEVFHWLDRSKHPVIVIFPVPTYHKLESVWRLPVMN